jgi:hypothetical protein
MAKDAGKKWNDDDRAEVEKKPEPEKEKVIDAAELSKLMTERAALKTDYEAETRKRAEEFTRKLHELEIQIARGQAQAPVVA